MSLGQFIAYAAIADDKEVSWLPSYGPEMRGGTSNCSVVVSDTQVASPIIAKADCLIAMNRPSLFKFEDRVRAGGVIIVNSSLIPDKVTRTDVTVLYVDANALALQSGNAKTANIVVLGAYLKASKLFPLSLVKEVVEHKFAAKPKVIPANLAALDIGYSL